MPKKPKRRMTTPSEKKIARAAHEVKVSPPKRLARTKAKHGAAKAEKQRRAIVLDKAREAGARIPKKRKRKK